MNVTSTSHSGQQHFSCLLLTLRDFFLLISMFVSCYLRNCSDKWQTMATTQWRWRQRHPSAKLNDRLAQHCSRTCAAFKPKSIYGTHFVASLLAIWFLLDFCVSLWLYLVCVMCVVVVFVFILCPARFLTFFPFTLAVKCNLSVNDEIDSLSDKMWFWPKCFWSETIIKVKLNGQDIVEWKTI